MRLSHVVLALVSCLSIAGCGDKKSPTAPTPPPTPTRVIRLEGNMNFGQVGIGATETRDLRIYNDGNEALVVTALNGPGAGVVTASWTSGSISPGSSQASTIRFTPTSAQTYSGTLTVNANQTSGSNTLAFTAVGVFPPRPDFFRSGVGDTVFDTPVDVARVRIIGTYTGNSSNFVVRIGGRLIVNELLGRSWSMTTYDGTLLTGGGGTVAITLSSGVSWSIQEIR